MTNRKERSANHIARYNISVYFLILWAVCISSVLISGRFLGPGMENKIPHSPTLLLLSTDTPTPVFTLPNGSTPTLLPPGLKILSLSGTMNEERGITVPNNTLIDATKWLSKAIRPDQDGKTSKAVQIYGPVNNAGGVENVTWRGGVIVGSIPPSWSWRKTHDFGGAGIFIHNNGPVELQYIRIHNVEDGIKFREAPEYSNTGTWKIRDCYFTAIRDDAIENDRFEPGTVQDCLFDGVYVFISEQDENVDSNTPIGLKEDHTIYINRVYARLYGTNGTDGPGKWFKLLGNVPHHKLAITDSVFAIGSQPRLGWEDEIIPREVSWLGNNNFILWLGVPGTYGGSKPEGVTFLEGQAAQEKWISVRNKWLTDHGLPPQNFIADFNPHTAPVMRIPDGF